jgi:hypothetical protein
MGDPVRRLTATIGMPAGVVTVASGTTLLYIPALSLNLKAAVENRVSAGSS